MSKTIYGKDRPSIFETIGYINTLLEKSNTTWSERVHGSFNSEIKRKMHDKKYWEQLEDDKDRLDEQTKNCLLKELVFDHENRSSMFGSKLFKMSPRETNDKEGTPETNKFAQIQRSKSNNFVQESYR